LFVAWAAQMVAESGTASLIHGLHRSLKPEGATRMTFFESLLVLLLAAIALLHSTVVRGLDRAVPMAGNGVGGPVE
jgi:hypothetical protein